MLVMDMARPSLSCSAFLVGFLVQTVPPPHTTELGLFLLQVTGVMRERTALNDTINKLKDQLATSNSSQEAIQTGNTSAMTKLQEDFKALSVQAEGEKTHRRTGL